MGGASGPWSWFIGQAFVPLFFQHRYSQADAEDADAASTSNYEFYAAPGSAGVTKGHMFTVLKFQRALDNVLCHVLLVDSEGSDEEARATFPGSRYFDYKLFAVAKMQSQILMIRPSDTNCTTLNAVLDDIQNVEWVLGLEVGKT